MLVEYQTLLVGCLGFLGVIVTLISNRKALERTHKDETRARRNAAATVMKQELDTAKRQVEAVFATTRTQGGQNRGTLKMQRRKGHKFFEAYRSDLGLFRQNSLRLVVRAYDDLTDFYFALELQSMDKSDGLPFIEVEMDAATMAVEAFPELCANIEAAISALEDTIN